MNCNQKINTIEKSYNLLADNWAKHFKDEHANKPMDHKFLQLFYEKVNHLEESLRAIKSNTTTINEISLKELPHLKTPIKTQNQIWDLGCGIGATTKYLNNLGLQVSGMDISENMIAEAKKACPHATFEKGNMLDLPFSDNSIAGIVSFYSIVHFTKEQVEIAMAEMSRVLRNNGALLITYHVGDQILNIKEFLGKRVAIDFIYHSTEFITKCLIDNGFEIDTIQERDPYKGIEFESRRAYILARKM